MQVVCEATQSTNLKVTSLDFLRSRGKTLEILLQIQVAALQNLVKILTLYYDYMEYYMGPALFAVSPRCSHRY